ncbi:hypothetical protein TNCV_2830011 [Trichonephila clavipes]|nr:hypothetical protein TNCV_2830011 [Trichonephila clavipes]
MTCQARSDTGPLGYRGHLQFDTPALNYQRSVGSRRLSAKFAHAERDVRIKGNFTYVSTTLIKDTGLRRSPWGLHTRTRLSYLPKIDSGFIAEDDLTPYDCKPIPSSATSLQTEVTRGVSINGSTLNGDRYRTVLQPDSLRWYKLTQRFVVKRLTVYG